MKISTITTSISNNQVATPKQSREGLQREITTSTPRIPALNSQIHELPNLKVEKVKSALESFNEIFKPTHLEFQMHESAGRYFVQIIDDKTQEVIKQIPSEEFLKMVAEAKEQLGFLIDERV